MPTTTQFTPVYSTAGSPLQICRRSHAVKTPAVFQGTANLGFKEHEALGAVADKEDIQKAFPKTYGRPRISLEKKDGSLAGAPLRVGVVLSGGQAPGGHNVIAGVFDLVKKVSKESVVIGFLDGPQVLFLCFTLPYYT